MKRIPYIVFLLAISVLMNAMPVQAAGDNLRSPAMKQQKMHKDECLLVARNCPSPDYRLQERINRLRDEIDKGAAVYTPEELRILRLKLEDARATEDFFNNEAPSLPLY